MTLDDTNMFGRRIGYNERKRKRKRARMRRMRIANAVRWFKRKGWVLTLLLVIAAVALWQSRFYLHQINPLELRHLQYIEIEGNRMLSWEDVVQSAQVETGMLMSELDADSVKKSLLQIPLIHSAPVFALHQASGSVPDFVRARRWQGYGLLRKRPFAPDVDDDCAPLADS